MKRLVSLFFAIFGISAVNAEELECTIEVFSLAVKDAASLLRGKHGSEENYRRIIKKVDAKAARQESLHLLKVTPEIWVSAEGIEEKIYPTEYDPGDGLGTLLSPDGGLGGIPHYRVRPFPIPLVSPSWETRNTGEMIELEAAKSEEQWDVRFTYSKVGFIKRDQLGRGLGMVEMPRFSVESFKGGIVLKPNKPTLITTMSPTRQVQGGKKKRVWFVFLTGREKSEK
ncbi:MAG: hypothetical protein PVJ98_07485 [Akkermansiaceae bacterium]|jgi:hypothetical protein